MWTQKKDRVWHDGSIYSKTFCSSFEAKPWHLLRNDDDKDSYFEDEHNDDDDDEDDGVTCGHFNKVLLHQHIFPISKLLIN